MSTANSGLEVDNIEESDDVWFGDEDDQEHVDDDIHYDSDELNHERKRTYRETNEVVDPNAKIPVVQSPIHNGGNIVLAEWQTFKDYKEFGSVLEDFAIQEGFEIRKVKFERERVTAECKGRNCPWRVHGSLAPDTMSFMIKTTNLTHTCVAVRTNSHVTSTWIAKKLGEKLRENPDIPINSMRVWLKNDYGVDVDSLRLWRARKKIRTKTEGDHKESFRKLRCYAHMVMRTNPGSIATVQSYIGAQNESGESVTPTFLRMFLCFGGVKEGFLRGCRPYVGVDGCHLKGRYKGVLLTAIGIDGNLQFFPLAYAIVESENSDSWNWFMGELRNAIGDHNNGVPWCVMSDRQKGILNAAPMLPNSIHRYCCYHLRNNFQKEFGDVDVRNKFWAAAETANVERFDRIMEAIKRMNEDAHKWLSEIPSKHWSLSGFEHVHKVEHLTNNHTESFNGWIDEQYKSRRTNNKKTVCD